MNDLHDALTAIVRAATTVLTAIGVAMVVAFVVFVLFAGEARAQLLEPDGKLTKVCDPLPRVPPLALPPPMNSAGLGLPKQLGGACTEAILHADAKGGAVGYWCPQIEPEKARLRLFAVQWEKVTVPMVLDFSSLLLLGSKEAAIVDIHRKYQTLNIRDMCDIWGPLVDRLNAIYPPPRPIAPVLSPYIVTPAGGATVRPAYPVTAGKRGTTANGTATPGLPCDCAALQIIEFNVARYCAAPSITAPAPAVTACTARPK